MKKIHSLISVIGPPGAGKSKFCSWFTKRNPIYKYIDIVELRLGFHLFEDSLNNTERLSRDREVWTNLAKTLSENQYNILETTGSNYRLKTIYDLSLHICTVNLNLKHEEIQNNIKARFSLSPIEDRKAYLEEDKLLNQHKWDITIKELTEPAFEKAEELIYLKLAEEMNN